ncbi:MAG TPA: hypothetical protein VNO33_00915 [Kofleriaceae bacterium]|nr:hypothetical protein [Kofleriaceae bacterium]
MTSTVRAALAGAAILSLGLAGGAAAQPQQAPRVAGKYSATFQEVANNCSGVGMSLRSATVELFQAGERSVQVTVPSVPIMRGVVSRAGKFKAEAKRGKTAIDGVDGRFSVAGRVDDKGIQLLFIAEYYRGKRPMCTQSWNASGPRQ